MTRFRQTTEKVALLFGDLDDRAASSRGAHQLARALLSREGRSMLIASADRERAHRISRGLVDDFDSVVIATTEDEMRKFLEMRTFDLVVVSDEKWLEGLAGTRTLFLNGADDAKAIELAHAATLQPPAEPCSR